MEALETERELQQTREENVRLAQVVSDLKASQEQLVGDGESRTQVLECSVEALPAETETETICRSIYTFFDPPNRSTSPSRLSLSL